MENFDEIKRKFNGGQTMFSRQNVEILLVRITVAETIARRIAIALPAGVAIGYAKTVEEARYQNGDDTPAISLRDYAAIIMEANEEIHFDGQIGV